MFVLCLWLSHFAQDQYAFIHDAVLESIMCGNTQVPAAAMKKAMTRLGNRAKTTDQDGFETQFHVSASPVILTHCGRDSVPSHVELLGFGTSVPKAIGCDQKHGHGVP